MLLLLAGLTARARSIEGIRRILGAPPPGSISAEYRSLLMRVDACALPRLRSNSTPPKSQPRFRYTEMQVGAHRLATGINCSPRMLRLQMSTRGTWRCHANNSLLSRASILVHRPERRSEWLRQSIFPHHDQLDSRHQTNLSCHQLLMRNSIRTEMDHE